MLIRVDCERTTGTNPKVFTVAISGPEDEPDPRRFDDADLARAVESAVRTIDARE
jgi:hypothetical protein